MFQTVNYYLYFNDKLLTLLNIVDFLLCGRVNVKHHWNSHDDHVIVFNFSGSSEFEWFGEFGAGRSEKTKQRWSRVRPQKMKSDLVDIYRAATYAGINTLMEEGGGWGWNCSE